MNRLIVNSDNDFAEILSDRKFQSFIAESTDDIVPSHWMPSYVARYARHLCRKKVLLCYVNLLKLYSTSKSKGLKFYVL